MIIFGTRSSQIAKLEVGDTTCNYCNQQGTQEVSVYGRYFHIFWIPILPMDKKVYSECTHCKKTIEQKDFPPDLKQKYQAVAPTAKRPIWHSLGILLVGGFFGLMLFFGILSSLFGKRTPPDPRAEAFKADMAQLSGSPSMQSDSLSFKLKMQLDKISKLDPENFEYFTKTMDDKLLVLVKIPTLKKLPKEKRENIVAIINDITEQQGGLREKKRYIGIHGNYNMMIVKTPTEEDNSNFVVDKPLYDFYGDALPEPK